MGGAASFQLKTDNHKEDGKQLSNNLVWYSAKKKGGCAFNVCVCMFYQVLKANVNFQNHVLEMIIHLRFTVAQQTSLDHEYALRGKCKGFKLSNLQSFNE